ALHGRLGDTEQLDTGRRGLGPSGLGRFAAERLDLRVPLLEGVLRHNRPDLEVGRTLIGDLHALAERPVGIAELEAIHFQTRQQVGVARVLDPYFPQHAGDDDLDVLIVDIDALAAIHLLDFVQQVLLHGFFAGDPQDVVRDERPIDESLAGLNNVARVHEEALAVRYEVFTFDTAFAADHDGALSAAL